MKIIVTCGPAYAPIDEVRRITNFATGEIGAILSELLTGADNKVTCFRGEGSTHPFASSQVDLKSFATNEDLLKNLRELHGNADAIFHAAALSDFAVSSIQAEGEELKKSGKIPSLAASVLLHLTPAPKILPQLRVLFPTAKIVGWKYEMDGDRESALKKAHVQIKTCGSDACVVNGRAYGAGFGFVTSDGPFFHFESKSTLAAFCAEWLGRQK
ncbi:MAG: phosphopantothenoylcysteine decarboxylase [Chthoniobacterales bacterium]